MPKGVVTPTVPDANDIVLGEFKVFANYELTTELELGACQGGCKVDIERVIKEIKFDGAYGPVKGLRRYESFNASVTLEMLCLKYFNEKIIANCESTDTWVSQDWDETGGTYAAETSIVAVGAQSAKATLTTTVHGIHAVFAADKDLTAFDNSEVSGTSDYIGIHIYISTAELADLGTSKIRLSFHNDAFSTLTNYMRYDIAAADLTADTWTALKIAKSAFTAVAAGAWTGVKGVSIALNGAPSAETVFYVDQISLIQNANYNAFVPVNGSGYSYTDEGTYRKFLPDMEIADTDYLENIAIEGQKHDGKKFIIILKNCLNDGNIGLALKEKVEIVTSTTFSAHYTSSSPVGVPLIIRDYDV
ncbi:MAG: hypothetical protein A3K77_06350 [Euryarchaeota archaeon RBG_13_31_8]|nr:MAG: hypothetical protein A3K77_06350 [Euryarchaeota archaeon RBG_13_31_8]